MLLFTFCNLLELSRAARHLKKRFSVCGPFNVRLNVHSDPRGETGLTGTGKVNVALHVIAQSVFEFERPHPQPGTDRDDVIPRYVVRDFKPSNY